MDEDDEVGPAIDELRGIVARYDLWLKAQRHVIAHLVAISGDLSWLDRRTKDADEHERATGEEVSARTYREELERIAVLAEAIVQQLENPGDPRGPARGR